ncbi:MAG TPA: hypothetical protein VFS21_17985 [Roseiflexaceae bacterium]|nr:hypothetical protein [Roseiflexaceae bacterium]
MTSSTTEVVICIRCGGRWSVDLARLGKPTETLYKGPGNTLRVEVFRLVCPNCGQVNMLEVTYERHPNA